MKGLAAIVVVSGLLTSLPSHAFPIASPGAEGFSVVAAGGRVIATYQGSSASYSNDLYLVNTHRFVFNNYANTPGDTVDLGVFVSGTELAFMLHVNDTATDYFSGPASRNPDAMSHARVQENWQPGETLASFEDLFGTPEGINGFNDLSFSFTNTASRAIPEPASSALLLTSLGLAALLRRRRLPSERKK